MGWLKGAVYRTKVDTCADLVARINNACVCIKDCRHELRCATRSTLEPVMSLMTAQEIVIDSRLGRG
jgi:hypothetical protein